MRMNGDSKISVFDLPQLYTKPSCDVLLDAISQLSHSISATIPDNQRKQVSWYLTNIISNSLEWIDDEDVRESLWESASRGLSDLSGYTASGARSRTFEVWPDMNFDIYEPGVTEGKTGFRVWGAAARMAQNVERYYAEKGSDTQQIEGPILELGSGTGLGGIAVSFRLHTTVYCSDLLPILPNLHRNIVSNQSLIENSRGEIKLAYLDWRVPSDMYIFKGETDGEMTLTSEGSVNLHEFKLETSTQLKFSTIIASDCLYSMEHPQPLVDTLSTWVASTKSARVMIQVPKRPGFDKELETFGSLMTYSGFQIESQKEQSPPDEDDTNSEDESQYKDNENVIPYVWTVWMWSPHALSSTLPKSIVAG